MTPSSPSTRILTKGTSLRRATRLSLALLTLALAGCASLSEKECLTVNWADQGYRDGRNGHPPSRVEDHREACSKVGVAPDLEQYQVGRTQGIAEYCTPGNAVREGRLGRSYRNACPRHLERGFLDHYELGYRAYEAQQQVDSLNRQMQQRQRALSKEKDEAKRNQLRRDLRDLDRRLRHARNELHDSERRLNLKTPFY